MRVFKRFIAGMVAIAQNSGFLNKVVPEDQLSDSNYCGSLYALRIYQIKYNIYIENKRNVSFSF